MQPASVSALSDSDEAQLWSDINARGWTHEHPEFEDFVEQSGVLLVAREGSPCFLAEVDGSARGGGSADCA